LQCVAQTRIFKERHEERQRYFGLALFDQHPRHKLQWGKGFSPKYEREKVAPEVVLKSGRGWRPLVGSKAAGLMV
jgi:hypothetical protein